MRRISWMAAAVVLSLATPALACAILPGTTRDWILRWAAAAGLRPTEGWLTTRDLAEADEAFLSSSVAGILPVTRFDGAPIGDQTWAEASIVLPDELQGELENVLTGEKFTAQGRLPLSQLLGRFPVALLVKA